MLAFTHSVPWVHILPAILAVVFGFLYLKSKRKSSKVLWSLLWLLFLPNTAYIITDVIRIDLHWNGASMTMRIAFIIQYIVLEIIGLATFLLAFIPLERMVRNRNLSLRQQIVVIMLLNLLVAFGMVLGRIGYTNSWVIFTNPVEVLLAAVHIITTFHTLGLVVLFWVLCNGIYFLLRKYAVAIISTLNF